MREKRHSSRSSRRMTLTTSPYLHTIAFVAYFPNTPTIIEQTRKKKVLQTKENIV
jgi:hypothetical protein